MNTSGGHMSVSRDNGFKGCLSVKNSFYASCSYKWVTFFWLVSFEGSSKQRCRWKTSRLRAQS